jgi:hypothetical protein
MKYIEELEIGEFFKFQENLYINTSDFKKDGSRLVLNLRTGSFHWLKKDEMVDFLDVYTLDESNNFVAIKEREKIDVNIKT